MLKDHDMSSGQVEPSSADLGSILGRPVQEVSFSKIVKVCPEHHGALLDLQDHYHRVYRDKVPITWLLYKILDEYFSVPENVFPRYSILDSINESRPSGRPLPSTGMLSDLDSFLLVTQKKIVDKEVGHAS